MQGLDPNLGSTGAVSHFEPQVAILCDASPRGQEAYQPKYMTEQGEWASDLRSKAVCLKDKMDILNYCKMVRKMLYCQYETYALRKSTKLSPFRFSFESVKQFSFSGLLYIFQTKGKYEIYY